MAKPLIVGFSASLRNARNREGSRELVRDIIGLADRQALEAYLTEQGNLHLEQFYNAGREEGVPFDQLYAELKKMGGRKGLSNSEVCLAAALWGAHSVGAEVEDVPLADFFRSDGSHRDEQALREVLLAADGVIIATPVYFGDRSSLSQNLIEFIRRDSELSERLKGKVYGGTTVGAKRNGGQETALIYQMHDMMDIGMLGVGNDFETTSQYGGTGHAGDVATMSKDEYGLNTCIGVGRRVARVALYHKESTRFELKDKVKIGLWVLQDKAGALLDHLRPMLDKLGERAEVKIMSLEDSHIMPCMACDICPSRVGPDEEFRCIRGRKDDLSRLHQDLLDCDVIIPAMYSPLDREGLSSIYQNFLERTRYIRRGDYAFSNKLLVPLVVGEVGTNENLNLRMTTSLIRHHTVLQRPIMGWVHDGVMLNEDAVAAGLEAAADNGTRLLTGYVASVAKDHKVSLYKPIGYVLSMTKDKLDSTMKAREEAVAMRLAKMEEMFQTRLVRKS